MTSAPDLRPAGERRHGPMPVSLAREESPRVVWALAWPVILALLSESVVALVDMLMVARLGATAVAAVGVGSQILGAVTLTMTAVATGTIALVARHVGAGARDEASQTLAQSMIAGAALGAVMVVPVVLWAEPIVLAFGVTPEVAEVGARFVRFVMLSVPSSAVLFVFGSGLRASGDTRTPLVIGIFVNVLNVAGNWLLIFGHLGFPALGVAGSAVATAFAYTSGVAFACLLLVRGRLRLRPRRADFRPRGDVIRRVLRVGYPAGIEQALMQLGFLLYLVFAARYGTDAIAAYFIGVRILMLSFLPGFGFAAASSTLVGQHLGAGNPARAESAGWRSTCMSVVMMSTSGLVIFLLAEPIAHLFVDEPPVVSGAVAFIHMLAISQPFMAMDFTLGGALRGAGDTRFPLVSVLIAFYVVRLGTSFVVAGILHLPLVWLWGTIIGDYIVRAALKSWRFRQGVWRTIQV
ncbi:MAG: MATE family efflux transporter [Deltaproteobacteria bacterium]|nr:MATE family efflux transporter [Deltaproteobacteria bacterium]